jgi:hypothetical protein
MEGPVAGLQIGRKTAPGGGFIPNGSGRNPHPQGARVAAQA